MGAPADLGFALALPAPQTNKPFSSLATCPSAPIAVRQVSPAQQVAEGLSLDQQPNADSQPESRWPSWAQMERIRQDSRLSALVGQNVVLNCAVQFKDGIEKPFVVNWLKYPHKQPIYIWYAGYPPFVAQGYESRVSRIGHASLNLSQVRETDQGLYECKIYYLDRRAEDKGNGTWIYLDVQGECVCVCVQLTYWRQPNSRLTTIDQARHAGAIAGRLIILHGTR